MAENLTPKKYINDNNIKQILTTVKNKIPDISECVTEEQLLAKDYATKAYVGEQIANIEHLKREIITVLPSDEEASDNVIYMLKIESATGNDKYQEYMKIDGTVQMIGDTSVDLTDYAKTADIPTTVAELADSADYAKKTDLHSHINKAVLDSITTKKVEAWDNPEDSIARNPVYEVPAIKSKLVSGESIGDALGKISKVVDDYVDGNLGGSKIWAGSSADFESQQDSIPVETTILIEDDLPDGSFVDSTLNILSENPVQNKVITKAINDTNNAVNVLNDNLAHKTNAISGTYDEGSFVTVDSIGYDKENKKLCLKVEGADTVIPFSGGLSNFELISEQSSPVITNKKYSCVVILNYRITSNSYSGLSSSCDGGDLVIDKETTGYCGDAISVKVNTKVYKDVPEGSTINYNTYFTGGCAYGFY